MLKAVSIGSSIFAVVVMTGCSGASQGGNAGLPGAILPSGVNTRYAQLAPRSQMLLGRPLTVEREFFVSDAVSKVYALSNATDKVVGQLTVGLSCPDGMSVDKKGNLYVANACAANVTEYRHGQGSPICTYSTGIVEPINVTTDATGNVYVVDLNNGFSNPGHIDKFAQCSNAIAKQYTVNGPIDVAVDTAGDMFVSYAVSGTILGGYFEEFKAGSSTPTSLGATVSGAGGLVLDKNRNLIADDQGKGSIGSVDVIAPPYNSAKVLVSGLSDPSYLALNAAETKLFSDNRLSGTVTIYSYPAGSLLKTVGKGNGIGPAQGVAESPNAVF